jgi:hypothetical protein
MIGVKWAVRRYSPTPYFTDESTNNPPMTPGGRHEQTFASWRDVCLAADTILGDHNLKMNMAPTDPVVFRQGEDVVLIYMKLELT